jgi:UDP-N-acetylglucosamine--N-acetylmuramyl-(pentapeptide) pyrophosphoryl-undecaprenol N-acetylglucosamine transferase
VPDAVLGLPERMRSLLRVSHQARPEDIERVSDAYAGAGMRADVRSFFTDMPDRISNAQLVIARAGASTVADISVIGRPSILIPLASAIRDEQTANARGLVEADAAVMVQESGLDAATLCAHIALILGDPAMAEAMAAAALGCAKPEAARDLADQVEDLGATRPGVDGGRAAKGADASAGAKNGANTGARVTIEG